MKTLLITLLVGFFAFFANLKNDFWRIYEQNSEKDTAEKAFEEERFRDAADAYFYLVKELKEGKDAVELNLGHSYFKIPDTLAAARYNALLRSENPIVRSIAHQQMGYLKVQKASQSQQSDLKTIKKNTEEVLEHFKNSLRADPANHGSRYNYELIKRIKAQQEENQEDKQDQDKEQEEKDKQEQEEQEKEKQEQEKSDEQKEQEEKDKQEQEKSEEEKKSEQEKSDEQKEQEEKDKQEQEKSEDEKKAEQQKALQDRLKQMNITPEKAEMLLEAMKNSEVQYLQQNRKKQTKKRDPSKPDW
jgi:hypothetical protein